MSRIRAHLLLPALLLACRHTAPEILEVGEPGAPGSQEAPSLVHPADYAYRVGPGDVLRVNVFEHPDLSSAPYRDNLLGTPVDGEGGMMLPLIGHVSVGGLTVPEVADTIEAALRRYLIEPHVDVNVLEFSSQRFYVFGAVREPGSYVLDRPMNFYDALSEAGGFDSLANRVKVAWITGTLEEKNLLLVDGTEIDPRAARRLAPGDLIFVGRRNWADAAEAARELIPILQSVAIPLSIALQAATLEKID